MTVLDAAGEATRPNYRVAISIPAGDTVKTGFAFDLANMVGSTLASRSDIDIRIHTVQSSILPKSRHDLALLALKAECTHQLTLDSDMRFPRYTLLRLLHHAQPIVGANYMTRSAPIRPVTFADDTDPNARVFTEAGALGLEEVASIGLGCALIDLEVYKALDRPWFSFAWNPEGKNFLGEDVFFCRRAREELGLKVYVDHGLSQEVRHIGEFEYTAEHALIQRDTVPAEPVAAG